MFFCHKDTKALRNTKDALENGVMLSLSKQGYRDRWEAGYKVTMFFCHEDTKALRNTKDTLENGVMLSLSKQGYK